MGLDIGERRTGVALCDSLNVLASPLMVISESEHEAIIKTILELVEQYQVKRIVVGLPLSMNGSIGPQARKVNEFAQELSTCLDIPVVRWDERLSTIAADKMMLDAGVKRRKRKTRRDAVAATVILQSYLDAANKSV
jgi:putative Holliday junction resolvase